jgi:hypothetical protein
MVVVILDNAVLVNRSAVVVAVGVIAGGHAGTHGAAHRTTDHCAH